MNETLKHATLSFRVLYREQAPTHGETPVVVSRARYREIGTVRAVNLEHLFRELNAVDGTEVCCKMGVRSMSVGDVAIDTRDDTAYYCEGVGWTTVRLVP